MHQTLRILALAGAATLAACAGGPTESFTDADAQRAAAEYDQLADSLSRAGADASIALSYRGLASLVRGGHLSPVTIAVDGSPTAFLATAREIEIQPTGACAEPGNLCLLAPPLRSMIAFDRGHPRRVVQLTSTGGMPIGTIVPGTTVSEFANTATLTYFDGAGGLFVGDAGTQSISDAVKSDTPCYQTSLPVPSFGGTCTLAQFTVSFNGTVEPVQLLFSTSPVTASVLGPHTLAMASQAVDGSHIVITSSECGFLCGGTGYPPGVLPPIIPRRDVLTPQLSAAVSAGTVTLTFTVTNNSSDPVTVSFPSTQQYDFQVRAPDGTVVWVWSATRDFLQQLNTRTVAAGAALTYVEQWTPPHSGSYFASARLASSSHIAVAAAAFAVP